MDKINCTCSAYPFPHRKGGGKCETCKHGKAVNEYCDLCADSEPQSEPSECLSEAQRNYSLCGGVR